MAGLWVTEILVAAIAGFVLFGDRVRAGTLVWAITGTAVALGATVRLALNYNEASDGQLANNSSRDSTIDPISRAPAPRRPS